MVLDFFAVDNFDFTDPKSAKEGITNDFLKDDLWRFWHFDVKQGSGEKKIIFSENHF